MNDWTWISKGVSQSLLVIMASEKYASFNRRFHGRQRHLGCGANGPKFTVNVWKNRDFDAR